MSRIVVSDEGYLLYTSSYQYPYGDEREVTWVQRKKPCQDFKKHSICFTDKSILEHPIVSKVKEFLTGSTSEMAQALSYEFATNEDISVKFPNVKFPNNENWVKNNSEVETEEKENGAVVLTDAAEEQIFSAFLYKACEEKRAPI